MPSFLRRRTSLIGLLMLALVGAVEAGQAPGAPAESPGAMPLEVGASVERELKGGETHAYSVAAATGDFVDAVVEQRGVDVVVTVAGPDGAKVLEVDSPNGANGPEPVAFLAEAGGTYRIVVRSLDDHAAAGRYEARLAARRPATQRDRNLLEAAGLMRKVAVARQRGMVGKGLPLAERAVALLEKELAPDHPDLAAGLYAYGDLLTRASELDRAEPLLRRALAIYEKAFGPEYSENVLIINALAAIEQSRGHESDAESLMRRGLEIAKRGGHDDLALLQLEQLANLYNAERDYARSLVLKQEVLAMRQRVFGPDHPDVGLSYNNLGSTYFEMGDGENAVRSFGRAVELGEKTLDPQHPVLAVWMNNLALAYASIGRYRDAEPLLLRSLAIREKAYGPDSAAYRSQLNNLGSLYTRMGDLDRAEQYLRRSLAIGERVFGLDSPALGTSIHDLAQVAILRLDYAAAEALTRRELDLLDKAGPSDAIDIAPASDNLARLVWRKGAVQQALALFERAETVRASNLSRRLVVGSARQRQGYVDRHSDDTVFDFVARAGNGSPRAARLALGALLMRKGRALDETAITVETLRRRATPEDRAALDALVDARSRLSRLTLEGPAGKEEASYRAEIASLEESADELEAQLSLRNAEFRTETHSVSVEDVQAAIPDDAVLVEFARYASADSWPGPRTDRYFVVVVRRTGDPALVDLGPAGPIDEGVAALRRAAADPRNAGVLAESKRLDALILRPIRSRLAGARRLLLSPDGALNLVPFAALVDESNRFLVERFSLSYLTSGRDLLRMNDRVAARGPATVIADPDFGGTGDSSDDAGRRGGPVDVRQVRFRALPGTAREARAIGNILGTTEVLTGARATEASIKGLHGPRLLHVATHGFFVEEAVAAATSETRGAESEETRIRSPLLRSGLALAGANRRSPGDAEDGILTALEASSLDLLGTRLVVLSACDTGVGETRAGEGVFGVRRALVLAGAETQVMSLWDVDDGATRELMVAYYKELFAGAGRADAMRRVQLRMLKEPKRRHPAYWASFIVSGDWRPLD